ncbi:MAG: asparagine synthase (glutamine-hydrolyzing) [Pseudomonadales bacterium]|jgi:asparagine synthase (glutamine-hydrolysing)|nr:asparagine synthase (glutamine-hydrolyzing) [Pseudomonadales bacterium]
MCGIAGFTQFRGPRPDAWSLLRSMTDSIAHRGPDAEGLAVLEGIALGHRRLAIIDLREIGNQPMASSDGTCQIVFNGEIYNFRALRAELEKEGVPFRTDTDTEVILALYARDGDECVHRLNGMFAFALWDARRRRLLLVRDRIGKKPLYLREAGGEVAFASELKALLRLPEERRRVRHDAVVDYFFQQYVPDPKSIFEGIEKLEPGCCASVTADGVRRWRYWSPPTEHDPRLDSLDAAAEALLPVLEDSVRLRLMSDVPLGAFLSGGVDSSGVVALMADASSTPVTTCSVGFDDDRFDELAEARALAAHFHCDHREFTVKAGVERDIERILSFFDEPFADPSLVPTYHVSALARQAVTVALSGDGGDEGFAGYEKYVLDAREHRIRSRLGFAARHLPLRLLARGLFASRLAVLERGASFLDAIADDPGRAYFSTNSSMSRHEWRALVRMGAPDAFHTYDPAARTMELYARAEVPDHLSRIQHVDLQSWLPGDILVKVDRMSMAHSLEARAPLLDYRVIEFGTSLPSHLKLLGNEKKRALRHALARRVPADVLARRKRGFTPPLADWLRGPLRTRLHDTLLASDAGLRCFFDGRIVRRILEDHLSGRRNHTYCLWSLYVFERWWQVYVMGEARIQPASMDTETREVVVT